MECRNLEGNAGTGQIVQAGWIFGKVSEGKFLAGIERPPQVQTVGWSIV